jgi:hypothetical protein
MMLKSKLFDVLHVTNTLPSNKPQTNRATPLYAQAIIHSGASTPPLSIYPGTKANKICAFHLGSPLTTRGSIAIAAQNSPSLPETTISADSLSSLASQASKRWWSKKILKESFSGTKLSKAKYHIILIRYLKICKHRLRRQAILLMPPLLKVPASLKSPGSQICLLLGLLLSESKVQSSSGEKLVVLRLHY